MIKNSLSHIPNIILLRSDKILYELINENSEAYILDELKKFYPNTFREPSLKNSLQYINQKETISLDYDFDFLLDLFNEFFEINGSHIYVKEDKLPEYTALINKIHPFNIIGFFLAYNLINDTINEYSILEFSENITTLAFKKPSLKEYADNHIHAGGSINDVSSLIYSLSNNFKNNINVDKLPYIHEFSYINSGILTFEDIIKNGRNAMNIIISSFLNLNTDKIFKDMFKTIKFLEIDNLTLKMIYYYEKGNFSKFFFLYNVLMFKFFLSKKDLFLKRAIKIFIHASNILRSYTLMSQNVGLSEFSKFNRTPFKKNYNNLSDIANSIIANGTSKFELKISIKDKNILSNISQFKIVLDKEIIRNNSHFLKNKLETKFINSDESNVKYHFCINFVRKADRKVKGIYSKQIRYYELRESLKDLAIYLDDILNNQYIVSKFDFYKKNKKYLDKDDIFLLYTNVKKLKNEYIDLSKLITTIDVAGDENLTPPEVFAPAVKFLRRDLRKINKFKFDIVNELKGNRFLDNQRLKLSVHVGEDFNYLVTGLRRIEETIKFYHMEKNDRLGHALALGLDFEKWKKRNGDIFVTKQEHLDNLVWLYIKSAEVSPYVNVVCKLRDKYIRDIRKLSIEIYGESFDIEDLYKAWELREYCPIYFDSFFENEYIKSVRFNKNRNEYRKAIEIYDYYQKNERVYHKGNEIIKLGDELDEYCIYEEEYILIEAIQDLMMEQIAKKGIILEANPTSNLYISYLNSFEEHPLFRWKPIEEKLLCKGEKYNKFGIRNSPLKVCINTDDPLIMPTTIYNEFNNLLLAAKKHSKNIDKIEKWLEELRKTGLEVFDEAHKKYEFGRF